LHTFARKAKQAGENDDIKKISAAHQAARDWVVCIDAEGYQYYYSGTLEKAQYIVPEDMKNPHLSFQDATVSDALKFKRELAAARLKKIGHSNPPNRDTRPADLKPVAAPRIDDLQTMQPVSTSAAVDTPDTAAVDETASEAHSVRRRRRARARKAQVSARATMDHEPEADRVGVVQKAGPGRRARRQSGEGKEVVDNQPISRKSTRSRRRRRKDSRGRQRNGNDASGMTRSSTRGSSNGPIPSNTRSNASAVGDSESMETETVQMVKTIPSRRRRKSVTRNSPKKLPATDSQEGESKSDSWRRQARTKTFTDRLQSLTSRLSANDEDEVPSNENERNINNGKKASTTGIAEDVEI
jgi:hypothetical protein